LRRGAGVPERLWSTTFKSLCETIPRRYTRPPSQTAKKYFGAVNHISSFYFTHIHPQKWSRLMICDRTPARRSPALTRSRPRLWEQRSITVRRIRPSEVRLRRYMADVGRSLARFMASLNRGTHACVAPATCLLAFSAPANEGVVLDTLLISVWFNMSPSQTIQRVSSLLTIRPISACYFGRRCHIEEMRNAHRILFKKSETKRDYFEDVYWWEKDIKTYTKLRGCKSMKWSERV
jgi:hypothetical protein